MPPSSNPLNTSAIGNGPMKNDARTSEGATNSGICDPSPQRCYRDVHFVTASEVDGDPVLGGVAHDGDDDDTDEERRQLNALARLGTGVHEDLGHPPDRRAGNTPDARADRGRFPRRLVCRSASETFVRLGRASPRVRGPPRRRAGTSTADSQEVPRTWRCAARSMMAAGGTGRTPADGRSPPAPKAQPNGRPRGPGLIRPI